MLLLKERLKVFAGKGMEQNLLLAMEWLPAKGVELKESEVE